MRIFFKILDEFQNFHFSLLWKTGVFFHGSHLPFCFCVHKDKECDNKWSWIMGEGGPGDARRRRRRGCLSLRIGSGLGNLQALSSCTTGPLLNPQQICHFSAFPMSSSYPVYCKPPEPHGDHTKFSEPCPGWWLLAPWWEGRWLQQQAGVGRGSEPLSDAHQPRIPSRKVLCLAPRLMYSQTSQMAGAEPSLCLQGGMGGKWILAGFTVLINPLLSDFQTDERGGPGAETCCRLAVLGTGFHPPSLMTIPCIWFPQVSKFQCCNPKSRKF